MAKGNFYTIVPGQPFLPTLVAGLKARLDEGQLAHAVIFLPNRRSMPALRDAFLNAGEDSANIARILPRIRMLADVDEDELLLSGDAALAQKVAALPPAIAPMQRAFLLMKLIMAKGGALADAQHAFLLACELGRLIDQSLIEGADLAKLEALVPENLAVHWQEVRDFLAIVHLHWPKLLAAEGKIDRIDRRQRLVRILNAHWQQHPPQHPVIAAGSTGSQPVMAELLATIAALPQGHVVLPGLDRHLEEEAWQILEAGHPQYLMARLLKQAGLSRADVQNWSDKNFAHDRSLLLSETMRPSSVADRWQHVRREKGEGLDFKNMQRIDARNEHEEAYMAALLLRQCVASDDCTAALVTPDRAIAARVAEIVRRWGIAIDDSAGTSLGITPVGSYISLLLALPGNAARSAQLLAFLKHPFTGCGYAREMCLAHARELERSFFRANLCGQGLARWLNLAELRRDLRAPQEEYMNLLPNIARLLSPLEDKSTQPFSVWLALIQKTADACLAEENRLWQGPEGEALATLIEELANADFACDFATCAAIVNHAMEQTPVRKPYGQHPRLAILGLLEARLLSYDRVILAGLNEGTWPQLHAPDPWMSRAMRVAADLALPDQRVGQMAHDFAQLAASANVTLLRSTRVAGAPALASRWLLRLDAVLAMRNAKNALHPEQPWQEWAKRLDQPGDLSPCEPPAVHVAVRDMPRSISVSDIETWVRDPYAFYARKMLGLKALKPLDAGLSARERGMAIHAALHRLAKIYPDAWPVEAMPAFIREVERAYIACGADEEDLTLIRARLPTLAESYWQFEKNRRATYPRRVTESRGVWPLDFAAHQMSLTSRADRIDLAADGTLSILDFKTGSVPKPKEIEAGFKPQLLLEAMMAQKGAFADVSANATPNIAYAAFNEKEGEVNLKNVEAILALESIHRPGFLAFINAYLSLDAVFHAAPRPQRLPPMQDYARLARIAEWSKGTLEQEDSEA